jgi:hypothetical protein
MEVQHQAIEISVRHALWVIVTDQHQRDGYWLMPLQWEGPGEYQHVTLDDGRQGLLKTGPW